MDARLEYGVEMGVEISLRILSTVGMYNLPHSINATIHVSFFTTFFFGLFYFFLKLKYFKIGNYDNKRL